MFTAEEVKKTINRIFELFPVEEVADLREGSSDIAEALNPDLLARRFRKSASLIYHYSDPFSLEDQDTKAWNCMFDQKAVCIGSFSNQLQLIGVNLISFDHELWLLEDMSFAHICCNRNLKIEGKKAISMIECRTLIGFIRDRDDLFFDAGTLFDSLADIGMFSEILTE